MLAFISLVLLQGCGQGLRGENLAFNPDESTSTSTTTTTGTTTSSSSSSSSSSSTTTSSACVSGTTVSCSSSTAIPVTSDLQVWLRADCLSHLCDSDSVPSWTNQGDSTASTFVQSTSTAQPKYYSNEINGIGVVYFDGGDYLTATPGSEVYSSAVTVLAVMKGANFDSATQTVFRYGHNSNGTSLETSYWNGSAGGTSSTTGAIRGSYGGNGQIDINDSLTSTDYKVITMVKTSGNVITLYNNTTSRGSTGSIGAVGSPTTAYTIGASRTAGAVYSSFFQGRIAELIVYNSALSDANRGLVVCYLSSKYGLGISGC